MQSPISMALRVSSELSKVPQNDKKCLHPQILCLKMKKLAQKGKAKSSDLKG